MLIHIVRHTTPDIDPGICYGQTDLPLAKSFEDESKQVLEKLLTNYDAIYTSPLQRCSQLSDKISSTKRIYDPRLMEYNFGNWELSNWADFKSEEAQQWMANYVSQPAPNGDSLLTMQARVSDFWNNLLTMDYETVAVVTHSGVQRLIHGSILETPIKHIFRLQLDFGAVLEINSDQSSGMITIKHR